MRFCLSNFKDFKNILTTAELILTEIKFEADDDGFRFRGFDGGKTTFFSVDFSKEYFDEYEIETPENIIVDASEINKIMKRIKNTDDVCVSINDYHMSIKVNDKKTFKIHAIDMDYDSPNLPNMEFPIHTKVDYSDFKDSINDSVLYMDKVSIESTNDSLMLSAEGVLGEYKSELLVGDELEEGYKSVFNNKKISSLFKIGDLADMVSVNLGMDFPILLELKDDCEELVVKLLVAPRIEEY